MAKHLVVVSLLYLALLVAPSIMISECSKLVCIDSEKQALLSFKQNITDDPNENLLSWVAEEDECCKWDRVVCNNVTGHVSELQLGGALLSGKISPSLLNLKHLTRLNLSNNLFNDIQIPSFLGSLVSLRYLDLTYAGSFVGMIPPQLGNLSNLHHLSIVNPYGGTLYAKNLDWLYGLSSLELLHIRQVNLSAASSNLMLPIKNLSSLLELGLSNCELLSFHLQSSRGLNLTSVQVLDLSANNLEGPPLCSVFDTMTHLQSLDLSQNNFFSAFPSCLNYTLSGLRHLSLLSTNLQGVIPSAISNITSLVSLDLSYNSLHGNIPSLGGLCYMEDLDLSNNRYNETFSDALESLFGCLSGSLHSLDLSYNLFTGEVPVQIREFKNLTTLHLHNNELSGSILESLSPLSNLKSLKISSNLLQGVVSEIHFVNLTNLKEFDASRNNLTLSVTPNWTPPFDLELLELSNWKLGHHFPLWLKTQKSIQLVGLSNTGISGSIPSWFWNFSSRLYSVRLSHNNLRGVLPDLLGYYNVVDLGSNKLSGPLPRISSYVGWLDLSGNSFSGELFGLLCNSEAIDSSLIVLHLGDNNLVGNIPDCWEHWSRLNLLDLKNNHLEGKLPSSMGLLDRLQSLYLGNNNLTGEIPASIKSCSNLEALNLGRNKLVGNIPRWIGSLPRLKVLIAYSNRLNGHIPVELCELARLRILHVADNNLSGVIPRCLKSAFSVIPSDETGLIEYFSKDYEVARETAVLVTQGKENNYESILGLVTLVDLSSNNISGRIPEELASLQGLCFLNLSNNHLHGSMPYNIGNMTALESLDLSWNKLSGDIPRSMSSLTFLSFLNLSHNSLLGEIPKSTQMQSFNSSSFDGNQLLCGDPLPKCRLEDDNTTPPVEEDDEDGEDYLFRVSVGVGFGVGFVGIIAPLVLCRFWRRAYIWFFQEYIWFKILDCIIKIKYMTGINAPIA